MQPPLMQLFGRCPCCRVAGSEWIGAPFVITRRKWGRLRACEACGHTWCEVLLEEPALRHGPDAKLDPAAICCDD